jgi:two-component system, NarL family, nitrate/nitrite response regulator NarL
MPVAAIRLMVVASDPGARSAWAARLSADPNCIVAGAVDPADASDAARDAQADVIVWDIGGDPEDGLAHLADLDGLRVPVVALVEDDREGARALMNGAEGVVAAGADSDRIVLAATAVLGGLLALDPAVAGFAGEPPDVAGDGPSGTRAPGDEPPVEALTRREREVLGLMAQGLGNKQLAERLGITEHTAKFHVHAVLGKLGTQSRTEAVVRAVRLGLVAI